MCFDHSIPVYGHCQLLAVGALLADLDHTAGILKNLNKNSKVSNHWCHLSNDTKQHTRSIIYRYTCTCILFILMLILVVIR